MKDGGPAFPCTNDGHPYSVTGMTLRDYAEIEFIAAVIPVFGEGRNTHAETVVLIAKEYANAWLKSREAKS